MVVELLSLSTLSHERVRKFQLYQSAGVQEYLLVTATPLLIEIFIFEGDLYQLAAGYSRGNTLASPAFPELSFDPASIFTYPIDPDDAVLEVHESIPPYAAMGSV